MAQAGFVVYGIPTRPVMNPCVVTAEPASQATIMVLETYGEREG